MCTCIKYFNCNVLGSMCHSPYVTYCPLELQRYDLHAPTTQQQFHLNITIYYYKIKNIAINRSFKYLNQLTWLKSTWNIHVMGILIWVGFSCSWGSMVWVVDRPTWGSILVDASHSCATSLWHCYHHLSWLVYTMENTM